MARAGKPPPPDSHSQLLIRSTLLALLGDKRVKRREHLSTNGIGLHEQFMARLRS